VLFKNKALHANTHPREVAMLFTIVAISSQNKFCAKTSEDVKIGLRIVTYYVYYIPLFYIRLA